MTQDSLSGSDPDYEHIRQQVTRHYNGRLWLAMHFMLAILGSVITYLSEIDSARPDYNGIYIIILVLISSALLHTLWLGVRERREEVIEQRWREFRAEQTGKEKPKRDRLLLSDEGELLDVVEDDWDDETRLRLSD